MYDSYYSVVLIIATLLAFVGTVFLVRTGKMKLITHRRIWNIILLLSFAISGLLGVILAVLIDWKMSIGWYREILWLHVEFGIVMAVIAVLHAAWHWRYFAVMFRKNKQPVPNESLVKTK